MFPISDNTHDASEIGIGFYCVENERKIQRETLPGNYATHICGMEVVFSVPRLMTTTLNRPILLVLRAKSRKQAATKL